MISNRGDQLYTDARCSSSLSCGVMPVISMEPLLMACDAFNAWRVHMSVQSLVSKLAHKSHYLQLDQVMTCSAGMHQLVPHSWYEMLARP